MIAERERMPAALNGNFAAHAPLKDLVWFRAGGPADLLFRPSGTGELSAFLREKPEDVPVQVIGVGSNLLIRDGGIPGVTLRLPAAFGALERIGETRIRVGAAALDANVARAAADAGIGGLEFLRGIPGTIGGALAMNAGCYGREMKDILIEARGMDAKGRLVTFDNPAMGFSYRHSAPKGIIFIDAVLEGTTDDPDTVRARMEALLAERERTQPVRAKTGGSTFTNPPGEKAWQLIDRAGCRGLRRGGAQVSEKHCNFLINTGEATAADIEALGEEVRDRVFQNSGIRLEWEIKRVGRAP